MAGPWDEYKAAEPQADGPWNAYKAAAPAQPKFDIDFSGPVADVRSRVSALPEDQQDAAWGEYAKTAVGREREAGFKPAPLAGKGLIGVGGLIDEMSAGIEAVPNLVTGGRYGPSYSEALAIQRERERQAAAASPVLNTIGELGSGIIGPGAMLKGGAGLLNNTARGVVAGAGYGGVHGFTTSEGGLENRLEGAKQGAQVGAVVGGVAPTAIAGTARAAGAVRDAVAPKLAAKFSGPDKAAAIVLANKMKKAGTTPQAVLKHLDEGRATAKFGTGQAHLPEAIADVNDTLQRTTGTIYRTGGKAAEDVKGFLNERQKGPRNPYDAQPDEMPGQLSDVRDATQRALGIKSSKSAYRTENDIIEAQRAEANKLYGDARANSEEFDLQPAIDGLALRMQNYPPEFAGKLQKAVDKFTQPVKSGGQAAEMATNVKIERLLEDMDTALGRAKTPQQAQKIQEDYLTKIRRAQEDLSTLESANRVYAAKRAPVNDITRFDAAKQEFDDMIDQAVRGGENNLARELTAFKHALLDQVHAPNAQGAMRNQLYKDARDTFSSRAEAMDALNLGRKAFDDNSEITVDQFKALTAGEKKLARQGLLEALDKRNAGKKPGDNATLLFQQKRVQEIMDEMIPGRKKGPQFGEYMARQENMSTTRNTALGGSPTAKNLQDDAENAAETMGTMWDKFRSSPSLFNVGMEAIAGGMRRLFGYNQQVASAMARRLLATDRAEQVKALAEIRMRMGTQDWERFNAAMGRLARSAAMKAGSSNAVVPQDDKPMPRLSQSRPPYGQE